ncbi:MAG: pyrroline-5-carboxylate reductase [Dehalococcoidales bacterium]|nr:pyrroline-5-carboxylate reductase [Dehalococcoidales bacterium]
MKIGFIGGGNMAEAMISAILDKNLASPEEIAVSDISVERLKYLSERYRITTTPDNRQVLSDRDCLVLAIKPQTFSIVAAELRGHIQPSLMVISILAGKNINTLSTGLEHRCIVRAMPNTPAQIGEGITIWTATPQVTGEQKLLAASLLGVMGNQIYIEEENFLDMATAVSGSGPAYIFLYIESMIAAAEQLGFAPELARKLVMQTITGSLHLLEKSGRTPEELRRMVTSPGGTTAEALSVFEQGNFKDLIARAVKAAYEKARQLGNQ